MSNQKKTLSERIEAELNSNSLGRKTAQVHYTVLKEDIEDAINQGWSAKTIWCQLQKEGKFPYGYSMFNKLRRENLYSKNPKKEIQPTKKQQPASSPKTNQGFNYQSDIDEKEII